MENISGSWGADLVQWGRNLRSIRVENELTLTQAGVALGISGVTLDGWEQGRKPQVTPDEAERAYVEFVVNTEARRSQGKNVLFGVFPVRIAKDILDLSQAQMAERLGYSHSSWSKMEANARAVPKDVIKLIEALVDERWSCARNAELVDYS